MIIAANAQAMGVTVFEAPHTTRHIAPRCSCAYVVWLGMMVASILLPYFVAFHTSKRGPGGAWRAPPFYCQLLAGDGRSLLQDSNL